MPVTLNIIESVTELGQEIVEVVLASSSTPGPAGPGVPTGGTDGQVLTKASATDYDTAWEDPTGGAGGAPTDATYLVTAAHGDLSAEVVVGATPGGELGGTWASPTVDATHSGSSHAGVQAAAEATAAAALAAHEADTTSVHGIADTSALALTANHPSNATFDDHSARHENGGADEISLAGLSGEPADTVNKSLFDANTVLAADSDNTPAAVTMGASTILARLAAGNIKAASTSEIRTLLDVPTNAEAVLDTLIDAKGDILAGTAADTIARVAVGGTNGMVLEVASGATSGIQWDLPPGWEYAYAEFTSPVSITATTDGTAHVLATASAVVLDGSTTIVVEIFSPIVISPGGDTNRQTQTMIFDAVDGGAAASIGNASQTFIASSDSIQTPMFAARRLTPVAGSHVYSFRAKVNAGTGSVQAGAGGAGNLLPAYIRIIKA